MYNYLIRGLLYYSMFFLVPIIAFLMAWHIVTMVDRPHGGFTDWVISIGIIPLWFLFFVIGEVIVFILICGVGYI